MATVRKMEEETSEGRKSRDKFTQNCLNVTHDLEFNLRAFNGMNVEKISRTGNNCFQVCK